MPQEFILQILLAAIRIHQNTLLIQRHCIDGQVTTLQVLFQRNTGVKIYFETQHDLLESRIRAMELKVRRAKLKDFDKQAYLAFISIVRKLDKYLWLKEEKKLAKIAAEIAAEGPLIQREWLLEWAEGKAHGFAG